MARSSKASFCLSNVMRQQKQPFFLSPLIFYQKEGHKGSEKLQVDHFKWVGPGEMVKGDFADLFTKKFPLTSMRLSRV
jgi:hypothetical protein